MIRFQHPEYLWFLVLVPVVALLYLLFISWRRSRVKKIGNPQLVKALVVGRIDGRLTTRVVLGCMALICCVLALSNPQAGGKAEKTQRKGIDIIFALDLSKSMLAKDRSPNRLSRAKQLIYRSLDKLQNDRIGLVVFAGNAYLQAPLTIDYNAVKLLLSGADPQMIPTQGTVLSDAIKLANESFSKKEQKHKVLVIISDGEDHDEAAISATKEAADQGVIVHTIGVGSPEGSTVIDPETGELKRDRDGEVVVSKLNESALKSIARAGNGGYRLLININRESQWLLEEIGQMEAKSLGTVVYRDYKSYFPWFLIAAIVFLLAEWLIPSGKKYGNTIHPARKVASLSSLWIALFMLPGIGAFAQNGEQVRKNLKSGNRLYEERNFPEAEKAYQAAVDKQPTSFNARFNLGDAQYQSDKVQESRDQFQKSLENAPDHLSKANAHYNIGNTFMKEKDWEQAISSYKSALKMNPKDKDARYNLAYAQTMLKKEQSQNQSQKNKQDKNRDQQDKNDQKKNKDQQNKQNQQNKPEEEKKQEPQDERKQGKHNKEEKQDPESGQDQQEAEKRRPQPQPSKLSQKEAENILNALNQEERKLHDKKEKESGSPVQPEKDW